MKSNNGIVLHPLSDISCTLPIERNHFNKCQFATASSDDHHLQPLPRKRKGYGESSAAMLTQMTILDKLKADLCKEEAKLIILKQLRSSQVRRSVSIVGDNRLRNTQKTSNNNNDVISQHCCNQTQAINSSLTNQSDHFKPNDNRPNDHCQQVNYDRNCVKAKALRGNCTRNLTRPVLNNIQQLTHSKDDVRLQKMTGINYRGNRSRLDVTAQNVGAASHTNYAHPYHPSFMINHQKNQEAHTLSQVFPTNSKNVSPCNNAIPTTQWTACNNNSRPTNTNNQSNRIRPISLTNANQTLLQKCSFPYSQANQTKDLAAQQKAVLRQNLQKSVDSFLYTIRLHKDISMSTKSAQNRKVTTFLPTNPFNFVPSQINHEFTMLLGLEEICKGIQRRMSADRHNKETDPSTIDSPTSVKVEHVNNEKLTDDKSRNLPITNKCSRCGTFCSPYFFHFVDQDNTSRINCGKCLRLFRIEQLSKYQLKKLEIVLNEHKKKEDQQTSDPKNTPCINRSNDHQHDIKSNNITTTNTVTLPSNTNAISDQQSNTICPPQSTQLTTDQLRLYHAQWMRQAALFNPSNSSGLSSSNQFPPTPFFTDAVATAAAIAAMSAVSQQNVLNTIQPPTSPFTCVPYLPSTSVGIPNVNMQFNNNCSTANSFVVQQTDNDDEPTALNLTIKPEKEQTYVPIRMFKPQ